MDYERPGQRVRTFAVGALTGASASNQKVRQRLKQNFDVRLDTAKNMIMGGEMEQRVMPLERRIEILKDTKDMLMGDSKESSETSSSLDTSSKSKNKTRNRSKRTSTSTDEVVNSRGVSKSSGVPSMSEVNVGTKRRAETRGFK